jgi:STAS domain
MTVPGDKMIVAIRGELDIATMPGYAADLTDAVDAVANGAVPGTPDRADPPADPPTVVLDLRELRFLSGAGVRMLLGVGRHCVERGVAMELLVSQGGAIHMLAERLGLDDLVPVIAYPSVHSRSEDADDTDVDDGPATNPSPRTES